MAWKNQLRPASFRGVPFGVEAHQTEQGRRTQIHEYPGRDDPYIEDLGKKAATFSVTGFVVGRDYMAARDKLLAACNEPGAGQLVHPYLGTLNVVCTGVALSESADDGGMAKFDFEFVVAGRNQFPAATADAVGGLLDQTDRLDGLLSDWFGDTFKLPGLPDFLQNESLAKLTTKLDVCSDLGSLLDLGKQSEFFNVLQDLKTAAARVDNLPLDLGAQVIGLFTQVSGSFRRPLAGMTTLMRAFKRPRHLSARRRTGGWLLSESLQRGEAAAKSVDVLFEMAALNAAAATAVLLPDDVSIERPKIGGDFGAASTANSNSRVAARNERESVFESLDEAIACRADLLGWIDDLAPRVPDELFSALQDLRQAVVAAVPDAENELPRLRVVKVQAVQPVLVLAYAVHGDATRSGELLHHNAAPHPGFMPVGEIKVLSDI